jgi:glycosyltransferase involved in cell wall biosynthesis
VRVSLVIPCFNESANLPDLAARCRALLEGAPQAEVVLVDNGSTDDTPAVLKTLLAGSDRLRGARVEVNQGYGFGILAGLRAATGDILGWTHADLQTDPADALEGLALFAAAAEPERLFVKGRRYGRPAVDVVFTTGMSAFETLLTGRLMTDINAQPTMFHRSFFETWTNPPSDFSLDLYAFWQARKAGLDVRRFPVRFGPRLFGVSHWNTGMAARWKFIRRTVDFSLRLRFGARA